MCQSAPNRRYNGKTISYTNAVHFPGSYKVQKRAAQV